MNIAVVIAATRNGLLAAAYEAGLVLLDHTITEFDTLSTFTDVLMTHARVVETNKRGWIALATRND